VAIASEVTVSRSDATDGLPCGRARVGDVHDFTTLWGAARLRPAGQYEGLESMRMLNALTLAVILSRARRTRAHRQLVASSPAMAVGRAICTTHVYVAPEDFDRSYQLPGDIRRQHSKQGMATVTPTPSSTVLQMVFTPVGTLSVFGFKTPVPYPFGSERTGYLVTDMDAAVARRGRAAPT